MRPLIWHNSGATLALAHSCVVFCFSCQWFCLEASACMLRTHFHLHIFHISQSKKKINLFLFPRFIWQGWLILFEVFRQKNKRIKFHNQIVTWPIQCVNSLMFNGCFYLTYLCKGFPEWALSSWTIIWTYLYLSSYNQKPDIQTVTKHLKISEKKN